MVYNGIKEAGQILMQNLYLQSQIDRMENLINALENRKLEIDLSDCEGEFQAAMYRSAEELRAVGDQLTALAIQTKAYMQQVKDKTNTLDGTMSNELKGC